MFVSNAHVANCSEGLKQHHCCEKMYEKSDGVIQMVVSCPALIIVMHQMQINMHGFMQVVMGYGHNKLSLEEAEELLKEVNYSQ